MELSLYKTNNRAVASNSGGIKAYAAALVLTTLFMFTACVESPAPTENYVRNFEPTYSSIIQTMFETDTSIYVLSGGTVWFTDKTYKAWTPLCGKPECSHRTDDCNAKIPVTGNNSGIYLYGSHIWYVDQTHTIYQDFYVPKLCRMELDGSNHEVICDLPVPETDFEPIGCSWRSNLHRNYLIVNYAARKDHSKAWEYETSYLLDLDDLTTAYVESDGSLPPGHGTICSPLLCADENTLYTLLFAYSEATENRIFYIAKVDVNSGRASLFCELPPQAIDVSSRVVCLKEDELILCTYDDATLYRWMYSIDIETGEYSLIAEAEFGDAFWGTLDSISGYSYAYITSRRVDASDRGFYAYDLDLNEISFLHLSEFPADAGMMHVDFITEDYVFLAPNSSTEGLSLYATVPRYYIEKSAILSGDLQVKIWEP